MRSRVRTVVIFLLTFGLLAFFFRQTDPAAVWAETRQADPWFLLAALGATGLTYVLRAWRWQSLLAPIGRARFRVALRTTVIGFAASALLPARAGEVLRPYLLARHERLSATAAFATIILERLLDLATVLLLFAGLVFTLQPGVVSAEPSEMAYVKFWGGVAGAASLAGLGVLFALAGHPERLGRLMLGVERILPARLARTLAELAETFAQGLAVMRQPSRLAVALGQSIPLWLSISAGIWLTSRAFHMTFPFSASFLVTTVLVVGVAMPTPGAVGGFHLAYQFAVMTFFAVPANRAAGAAIVLHAISFIPVTIAGGILMALEGITLSGARQIADADAAAGSGPASGPTRPVQAAPIEPLERGVR
jgi:glycosyltransferase 2 family protein